MKIGFIGCVESSFVALECLLTDSALVGEIEVVSVITKPNSKGNSDFVDLTGLCKKKNIPYYEYSGGGQDKSIAFMETYSPDVIYCVGWSHILPREFIELPEYGIIGFHPAELPKNRGRHPIIWALALGLESTASTFFKMDESADSGPILSQEPVGISTEDNARSLYDKILALIPAQVRGFTLALSAKSAVFKEQDHELSNEWRKRSRKDGIIDWRMHAEDIRNLIRALCPPYPGAELYICGQPHQVYSAKIHNGILGKNIEPGRVLFKEGANFCVKCGGGSAIWITKFKADKLPAIGDCL
ncbi:hypothetical protein A9Q99_02610 [Gammaproteobacteria bacterium 45_16_T64]|nr:hypothetical protein A9Q99_02610 [Gammaproteobacteria bacterium 45_16_T64]